MAQATRDAFSCHVLAVQHVITCHGGLRFRVAPCLRKVALGCQHRGWWLAGARPWAPQARTVEPSCPWRESASRKRFSFCQDFRGGSSGVLAALVSARALGAVGFLPPHRPVASVTVAADIRLRIDCWPSRCFKFPQNAAEARTVDRHWRRGRLDLSGTGVGRRHSLRGWPEPVPWPLRAGGAFPGVTRMGLPPAVH